MEPFATFLAQMHLEICICKLMKKRRILWPIGEIPMPKEVEICIQQDHEDDIFIENEVAGNQA